MTPSEARDWVAVHALVVIFTIIMHDATAEETGASLCIISTACEPNSYLEIKINNTPRKKSHGVRNVFKQL